MKALFFALGTALWVAMPQVAAAEVSKDLDVRRAVPTDAFMVFHGKHNPERDFQRAYYREVWDTLQETKLLERALKIATDRLPEADVDKAKSVLDQLREAVSPIDVRALLQAEEFVYAQALDLPSSRNLVLVRMTPEAAADTARAFANLFGLVERFSDGAFPVKTLKKHGATITALELPPNMPMRPAVAHVGGVFLLSDTEQYLLKSLKLLTGGKGKSKFDDPRLKKALSKLPEPEDSLLFYDGRLQFAELQELGEFIRSVEKGKRDANSGIERLATLMEQVYGELAIFDFEVTVGYTEGNQNRTAVFGKRLPDARKKVLAKVLDKGESFENWQTWVPADALSYSLNTGANLHPAYVWILKFIREQFPEAEPGLEQFAQLQREHDVYLDRDLLQAFSGEFVSITLPPKRYSAMGGQDSVFALRCHKSKRIRELMHRLFDAIAEVPFLKAQRFGLSECEDLEGFDEISALLLTTLGVKPVVGFSDGWMFFGSGAAAVEQVLTTRAGEGDTIAETEAFERLNLEFEGPVEAISYSNLAENTRNAAKMIGQVGMVAPMLLAMAGADMDPKAREVVEEVLKLLPSVAQVVAKFDFLEANASVTQWGDQPGTYLRQAVILVRPASEDKDKKTTEK